jgi:hypothetical protein
MQVLHRPSELAALIGEVRTNPRAPATAEGVAIFPQRVIPPGCIDGVGYTDGKTATPAFALPLFLPRGRYESTT